MDNKIVMNEKENKQIHTFKVGDMLNPELNINKSSREQVKSNMDLEFSSKTMIPIRKVLRKDNTQIVYF